MQCGAGVSKWRSKTWIMYRICWIGAHRVLVKLSYAMVATNERNDSKYNSKEWTAINQA